MADIELVIKINEDTYKAIQRRVANPKMMRDKVDIAIANGTPLPKGHGRLIDANHLVNRATIVGTENDLWDYYAQTTSDFVDYINDEPTIIEADKGVKNNEYVRQ